MDKITVLSAYTGLGVYVPSLLVAKKLAGKAKISFLMLEDLYEQDKKDKIKDTITAFQANFKTALMAQRMSKNVTAGIDKQKAERLLLKWEEEKIRKIVVFSGFWMPIVYEYQKRVADKGEILAADLVFLDADVPVSWKKNLQKERHGEHFTEIRLFDIEKGIQPMRLEITPREPVVFEKRENRMLLHGGGWSIGTYKDVIPELQEAEILLSIAGPRSVYSNNPGATQTMKDRFFSGNPNWEPWIKNEHGEYIFPPLYEITGGIEIPVYSQGDYHPFFELVSQVKGTISKPGGAGLIDSFSAATPIIFLEPYGESEKNNAAFWQDRGFGISYKEWKTSGFSQEILKKLHRNILEARKNGDIYKGDSLCSLKQR